MEYIQQDNREFLCRKLGPEDKIDTVTFGMLQNNRISGLLPMHLQEQDDEKALLFDVTGLSSLQTSLRRGRLSKSGLLVLLKSLANTVAEVEDYLIPEEMLVFDDESIFLDPRENRAVILCLPIERTVSAGLREYCRLLLRRDTFDPSENQRYLDLLYTAICVDDRSIASICDAIRAVERGDAPPPPSGSSGRRKAQSVPSAPAPDGGRAPQKLVRGEQGGFSDAGAPRKLNRGGYDGGTMRSGGDEAGLSGAYLVREKTGEQIPITKSEFRLGKNQMQTDFCIQGNPTISRLHAAILYRNRRFFIVDKNSANGTYVNKEQLRNGQEVPLSRGDSIRLSNEMFYFFV